MKKSEKIKQLKKIIADRDSHIFNLVVMFTKYMKEAEGIEILEALDKMAELLREVIKQKE